MPVPAHIDKDQKIEALCGIILELSNDRNRLVDEIVGLQREVRTLRELVGL